MFDGSFVFTCYLYLPLFILCYLYLYASMFTCTRVDSPWIFLAEILEQFQSKRECFQEKSLPEMPILQKSGDELFSSRKSTP